MISKPIYLLLFVAVMLMAGCHRENNFSYRILDGDTDISKLPFGNNQNLNPEIENKIDYKIIDDTVYTSVYIGAHAGCPGTRIAPKVRSENGKLILSVAITKGVFSKECLLNVIQLNFRIRNSNYNGVYYVPPKSSRPG